MIVIERTVDISRPVQTETLRGSEFTGEVQAHTFKIHVTNDGLAVALTGTVTGKVLLADGTGQMLGGSVESGAAMVTLTQPCYEVPGRFHLAVYHTTGTGDDTDTTCIYSAVGSVSNATGSPEYAPGSVIPTPEQLAEMIDEVERAISENTYPVSYDTENPQSLSADEQAQARANIMAANADDVHVGLIEYGYMANPHSGTVVKRAGTKFTITSATFNSSSAQYAYKLSNDYGYGSNAAGVRAFQNPIKLRDGHTYRWYMKLISGTATRSDEGAPIVPQIYDPHAEGTGTVPTIGRYTSLSTNEGYSDFYYSTALYPDGVHLAARVLRTSATCTFTNAVYEFTLTDITPGLPMPPTTDGQYTLKATVASSVPTYSWVADGASLMMVSPTNNAGGDE